MNLWRVLSPVCHLLILVLVGGCGSIAQAPLPRMDAIAPTHKLPIDGIWQPEGQLAPAYGSIRGRDIVFKVEGGRASLYGGNMVGADGTTIVSSGAVVMKEIRPASEPRKYQAVCAIFKTNTIGFLVLPLPFDPCEIEIQGATTMSVRLLDASKHALPGLNQILKKEVLENEAWFLEAYQGKSSSEPPESKSSIPPSGPVVGLSTAPSVPPAPASSPVVRPTPTAPRRALVIGNAAYADSPLRNSIHDATDIADTLRRFRFEVTLQRDADKPTLEKAVDLFTQGVPPGSVGLFFFSGHGVQVEGVNYLVPLGARFSAASDVKYYAVAADWILARMDESGMDVKLLILDACRNNPLGRSWTRALSRGLAVMETPKGSLIAYATSPGKTADDGRGRNSPFTMHLLREVLVPGRPIELVFKAVRVGVQQETGGQQIPWEASSLSGEFIFVP